ncbi:hypothetical protein P3T37_004809 [Kitasatospora sp. MAA4]|nr:hypothetical protein [Kitasatospora sp. MAA4]
MDDAVATDTGSNETPRPGAPGPGGRPTDDQLPTPPSHPPRQPEVRGGRALPKTDKSEQIRALILDTATMRTLGTALTTSRQGELSGVVSA